MTPRKVEIRVHQEGKITLPLIGDIPVAGLTTTGVEQLLQERFNEYVYNPQVGVHVKEYRSQRISVVGAVRIRSLSTHGTENVYRSSGDVWRTQ